MRVHQRPDFSVIISWQYVFIGLIAAILLTALFLRKPNRLLWEVAFTAALFLGVWYLLMLVFPTGPALLMASILTLSHLSIRAVALHNLFFLLGGAGVAVNFAGWLSPEILIMALVGFAIYDKVAGPPGGPIQSLAGKLIAQGLVPGIIVVGQVKDLLAHVRKLIPQNRAAVLGSGDVILPLSLVASAAKTSPASALLVLAGIITAILVMLRSDVLQPRAALPPLAIGASAPFVLLRLGGML